MKTTIATLAAAALIAFSAPAVSDDQQDKQKLCKEYESIAAEIMKGRQEGVSMSAMMDITSDNEIVQAIVQDAYNQPRYNTSSVKRTAIEDFSNTIAAACYKEL